MSNKERAIEWLLRHNMKWNGLWKDCCEEKEWKTSTSDGKKEKLSKYDMYIKDSIKHMGLHEEDVEAKRREEGTLVSDQKVAGPGSAMRTRGVETDKQWEDSTHVVVVPDGLHLVDISEYPNGVIKRNRENIIKMMDKHFLDMKDDTINLRPMGSVMYSAGGYDNDFFSMTGRIATPYDNYSHYGAPREGNQRQYEIRRVFDLGLTGTIYIDVSTFEGVKYNKKVHAPGSYGIIGDTNYATTMQRLLDTVKRYGETVSVIYENSENDNKAKVISPAHDIIDSMKKAYSVDYDKLNMETPLSWSVLKDGHLRYKFGVVNDFIIRGDEFGVHTKNNRLYSLINFPEEILGSFIMRGVWTLETLEGFPKKIHRDVMLDNCELPDTDLPSGIEVGGNLFLRTRECNYNEIYRMLCKIVQSDMKVKGNISSRLYTGTLTNLRKYCKQYGWKV